MIERLPFYCDIDDTLIMHSPSITEFLEPITITVHGRTLDAYINPYNVQMVVQFYKLGRDVYFWSGTGKHHAKAVAEALGLAQYAANEHAFLCKPIDYYLDDKDASKWMGKRIWKDPITGSEE